MPRLIVDVPNSVPTNIGCHGYPKTVCPFNHVVCHGTPSAKHVKDGGTIDVGAAIMKDGWYGDTSRMYFVGKPGKLAQRLVGAACEAMHVETKNVRPEPTIGDIGHANQTVARREGFSVVRRYCGHGIGHVYQDEPQVLHFGLPGAGLVLKPGMIFPIEPMLQRRKADYKRIFGRLERANARPIALRSMGACGCGHRQGYEVLTSWPDGYDAYADIISNNRQPQSGRCVKREL